MPIVQLKMIMFHSQKGGTGKSTLSSNVAYTLAEMGHKTVLIDLDLGQPSISHIFNIPKHKIKITINDVLFGDHDIEEALIQHSDNPNLYLVVGKDDIELDDELILMVEKVSQDTFFFFHESVKNLQSMGVKYVIFDCAPGYKTESVNASIISDARVLVIRPNTFSFFGAKQMILSFYNKIYTDSASFFVFNQIPPLKKPGL